MEQLIRILFLENSAEGLVIIFVLLGVLGTAVYFAQTHTKRYQILETNLLNKVIARLKSLDDSKDEESPVDALLKCLPKDSKGRLRDSIIGSRLLAIQKMRSSHAKVNVQALQEMSIAKEASRKGLGFPSFVVGFAMLLGLLGTIIGLTKMVQTIHLTLPTSADSLTPDKWSQSLDNVRTVLSSMKSAFSATLVGLFCSIVATLLNLRLEKSQSRFFEKLERFTIEELLPKTAPSIEDEELLVKVSIQMEKYFEQLQEVAKLNNDTIQDLTSAHKAFETTIAKIQEISRGDSAGSVQQVIGQMAGVMGELSAVNRSIVSLAGRVPETLEVARKANDDAMQRLDTIVDTNRQWQTRIDNSLRMATQSFPVAGGEPGEPRRRTVSTKTPSTSVASDPLFPFADGKSLDSPLTQRAFLIFGALGIVIMIIVFTFFR